MEGQLLPIYLRLSIWIPLVIFVPLALVIRRRLRRDDPGERLRFFGRLFLSPLNAWYMFVFFGVSGSVIGLFDPSDAAMRWISSGTLLVSGLALYLDAGPLFVIAAEVRFRNRYGTLFEDTPRLGTWHVQEIFRDILFRVSDEPPVEDREREEEQAPQLHTAPAHNSLLGSARL